jgi:hypothetical protein
MPDTNSQSTDAQPQPPGVPLLDPDSEDAPIDPQVLHYAEAVAIRIEWLVNPWLFSWRYKLSFSLFEFWLTMLAASSSIALFVSRLARQNVPVPMLAGLAYLMLHSYAVALLGAVYHISNSAEVTVRSPRRRLLLIALYILPMLAVWVALGLLVRP